MARSSNGVGGLFNIWDVYMMLSKKAKYALKALMLLARSPDCRLQTRQISGDERIPIKFLEAIMSDLNRHGILDSKRGISGGHKLSRPADQITAGEIIRIIDGPLAPVRCASITAYQACEDCIDEDACAIRAVMQDVRGAMSQVLDRRTIQDMI